MIEVIARLKMLWELTNRFCEDAKINGMDEGTAAWQGDTPSDTFVDLLAKDIPLTHSGIYCLEETRVAVDLIRHVAECLIGKMKKTSEINSLPKEEDHAKLAFVSAGLFLLGGQRHTEYQAEFARQAHEDDISDFAARVLLARMWNIQKYNGTHEPKVQLKLLICNWEDWLGDALNDYGEQLTANLLTKVYTQVRHGHWPTDFPFEWLLYKYANIVIDASHQGIMNVEGEISDIQTQLMKLGTIDQVLSKPIKELLEKIYAIDPNAATVKREDSIKDVITASKFAQVQPVEELADAIYALEEVDHGLIQSLHKLASEDREMHNAINQLTESFPLGFKRYLLTWNAKSGRLSGLIDYLAKSHHGHGKPKIGTYKFEKYCTPYARSGLLPLDQDFDTFVADLNRDLNLVYSDRNNIVGNYHWPNNPPHNPNVYVWLLNEPKTINLT